MTANAHADQRQHLPHQPHQRSARSSATATDADGEDAQVGYTVPVSIAPRDRARHADPRRQPGSAGHHPRFAHPRQRHRGQPGRHGLEWLRGRVGRAATTTAAPRPVGRPRPDGLRHESTAANDPDSCDQSSREGLAVVLSTAAPTTTWNCGIDRLPGDRQPGLRPRRRGNDPNGLTVYGCDYPTSAQPRPGQQRRRRRVRVLRRLGRRRPPRGDQATRTTTSTPTTASAAACSSCVIHQAGDRRRQGLRGGQRRERRRHRRHTDTPSSLPNYANITITEQRQTTTSTTPGSSACAPGPGSTCGTSIQTRTASVRACARRGADGHAHRRGSTPDGEPVQRHVGDQQLVALHAGRTPSDGRQGASTAPAGDTTDLQTWFDAGSDNSARTDPEPSVPEPGYPHATEHGALAAAAFAVAARKGSAHAQRSDRPQTVLACAALTSERERGNHVEIHEHHSARPLPLCTMLGGPRRAPCSGRAVRRLARHRACRFRFNVTSATTIGALQITADYAAAAALGDIRDPPICTLRRPGRPARTTISSHAGDGYADTTGFPAPARS